LIFISDNKTMKVIVTQKHIDKGRRYDCFLCPISLALREVNPQSWKVTCSALTIRMGPYYFNTPFVVQKFILAFDRNDDVSPFEFELVTK
jgi:hypothetical protein